MKWSAEYNVAFACGIPDSRVDKFEDEQIAASRPFTIFPGDIAMDAPFSAGLIQRQKDLVDEARKGLPKNTPKGTRFDVPVPMWNELLLLPKAVKSSDIHKLSDITRYGGVLTSQGFPK
jgi:hypothetical protein